MGIQWGSDRISRDPGFLHYCQGHMKPRGSYPTTAPLYNINRGEFWERCAFFGGRGGERNRVLSPRGRGARLEFYRGAFLGQSWGSRTLPSSSSGTDFVNTCFQGIPPQPPKRWAKLTAGSPTCRRVTIFGLPELSLWSGQFVTNLPDCL